MTLASNAVFDWQNDGNRANQDGLIYAEAHNPSDLRTYINDTFKQIEKNLKNVDHFIRNTNTNLYNNHLQFCLSFLVRGDSPIKMTGMLDRRKF